MRVAVLGAGYAGLTVARRLERRGPDDLDLVVVDESDTHLVQHELHRIVRYPHLAETITVPLSDVLSEATVRQARVTDVDPEAGVATLSPTESDANADDETAESSAADDEAAEGTVADEETLEYDLGVVCLGAETEFYDLPGVEEHARPLKRLVDARAIREDAMDAAGGHAVVGGGGLSGVQVAGELVALSETAGLDLDVTIVERNDAVAPGFDTAFQDALHRELDARDVTVETGVAVDSADAETVTLGDGRSIPYDLFVWTGGIRGPAPLDGERVRVESDLQASDSTYVVGDAATVVGDSGEVAPASAQTALRQATVAASAVRQRVTPDEDHGDTSDGSDGDGDASQDSTGDGNRESVDVTDGVATYDYDTAGWVVSVGDGAVAQVGPVVLSGEPARAAKAVIGAGHLGSVGAIGNAADLVAEELGWPTHDSVLDLSEFPIKQVPTDPASASDLQSTLGATGFALADAFAPGDTVDLTLVTRLADRSYPDSPLNYLEQTVLDGLSMFVDRSRADMDDEDGEN